MNNLLYRLTSNLPMRLIDLDLVAYLERYHLAALGGCRAWLHHFVSADADRNVHDHPWPAISIILTGGYRELVERADGSMDIVDHNAPAINFIPARKRHRIIQMEQGTWSLMLVGPRHGRGWTVYNNDGTSSHEPDEGRNLDWQKTAGNRAAAYANLNGRRLIEQWRGDNPEIMDAWNHAADALKYAFEPIFIGYDPAAGITFPSGASIDFGDALTPEQAAARHDASYAAALGRRRPMTRFEWLTRCQRELVGLTLNDVGDWSWNAVECWQNYFPLYPNQPERAAACHFNDEFTNGR